MTDQPLFPDLHGKVMAVRAALLMVRRDPKVLDHPACHYDEETKQFLRVFAILPEENMQIKNIRAEDIEGLDDYAIVETQILNSLNEIFQIQKTLKKEDVKEKLDFHKLAAQLMERFIVLREKMHGVKQAAEFTRVVLDIIETIMTSEQRTLIMERLEPYSQK